MTLGEMRKLRSWASLSNEFGADRDGDVLVDDSEYGYAWGSRKQIFTRGRVVKIVKVAGNLGAINLDQNQYMAVYESFFIPQEVI